MFFWKKQKKAEPEVLPIKNGGFFSTDIEWPSTNNEWQRQMAIDAAVSKSIQRTIADATIESTSPNGQNYAMDDCSMPSVRTGDLYTGGLPDQQLAWFANQGFIGYQACAILAQNWLIQKVCAMPAYDAVRHWYDITVNDGEEIPVEILDYIKKRDKQFKLKKNAAEFITNNRIFGIRVALFVVESSDPDYYLKPFNPDGITPGSYKGISQIDPYWMGPILDLTAAGDPAAINFYEPTWWTINGKRIHRSHLVIIRNGEVPDILKPTYLYGGIPVPQKISERVYAAEKTANEAPMLAATKRMTVLHLDAAKAAANPSAFTSRMNSWLSFLSNFGVKVVGESEKIEQFDCSLADLDEVIMTQFQIVAAAGDIPATKVLGTQPKGFNSTGEYEEASYHEMLESIQENQISMLVERHHLCLMRSEVAPKFGIAPFEVQIAWNPLDARTAEEQADVNLKKAQTAQIYANIGAIDGADVRDQIIADKESGFNGMEKIEGDPFPEDEESFGNEKH